MKPNPNLSVTPPRCQMKMEWKYYGGFAWEKKNKIVFDSFSDTKG